MELVFNSNFSPLKKLSHSFSQEEIKNETMLFSADYEFARKNGDGLTHLFLDNLPEDFKKSKLVIDTRVHMLMPGWYPCIPGWHHDDIPRKGRFGQPNYIDPEYYSEHILMVVNSSVAPTEFLTGNVVLKLPSPEEVIYNVWNKEINLRLNSNPPEDWKVTPVEDSTLYVFNWETFHRGTVTVKNGWRFFIRASRYFKDKYKSVEDHERFQRRTSKNQIRRQVQIYMSELEAGW